MSLPDTCVYISESDWLKGQNKSSLIELDNSRGKRRKHELMQKLVVKDSEIAGAVANKRKSIHIEFFLAPHSFSADASHSHTSHSVHTAHFNKTTLIGEPEKQFAVIDTNDKLQHSDQADQLVHISWYELLISASQLLLGSFSGCISAG